MAGEILKNFTDYLKREGKPTSSRSVVVNQYNAIHPNTPFFSKKSGYATYGEWYDATIKPKLERGKPLSSYEERVIKKYQQVEARHAKYHPTLQEARGHGREMPVEGTTSLPINHIQGIGAIKARTYNDKSKLGRYFNAVHTLFSEDSSKEAKAKAKKTIQQLHKQKIYDKDNNAYHTPTLTETQKMYEAGYFDGFEFESGK